MNVMKARGMDLAASGNLFEVIDLALDLSELGEDEVEVWQGPSKIASFRCGKRTYPAHREPSSPLNLAALEAWAIMRAMEQCGGDVRAAADVLGIGVTTLYRKLRELKAPAALARAA